MITAADATRLYEQALEAQRRAQRDEALARLTGCEDWPIPFNEQGLLLRAEVLTFRDPILGLEELATHSDAFTTPNGKFGYYIASARAYTNSRNFDGATAMLDAAEALLEGPQDERRGKVAHFRARLLWSTKNYDPHSEYFNYSLRDPDPTIRFSALLLRSWMHAGLEDYRSQLQDLLAAFRLFDEEGYRCDLSNVAIALHATLRLAFELGDDAAVAAGEAAYDTIEWTRDIQDYRFLCVRALAWHAFLQGEPARAQWLFKESNDFAPSVAWQVMAHVDRAFVARMNLNEAWATEELYQAHALARTVSWSATSGEERMALMTLAVLFAPVEMSQAQRYVSTYIQIGSENLNPTLAAAHEARRNTAFQKFAEGRVQAVLGNTVLAIRSLESAYEIFTQIEHEYRAALAAQALYEITKHENWLKLAQAHAAKFPKSAIYQRMLDKSVPTQDEQLGSLSATQRQIAVAFCQGTDMEELSRRFSRSVFTLQKQVDGIYAALNVKTRMELRNELHRRGLM
jgi:DNA-binding CsgD family transcriptional regulator